LKSVSFSVKGLDVTYYQTGIHRFIKVELPEETELASKSKDTSISKPALLTKHLFVRVKSRASDFNTTAYKLTSNNCVSAVSSVLNNLEHEILQGVKKVVPHSLDSSIKKEVKVRSMADEIFRGSLLPQQDPKHLDYKEQHDPKVWQAMTDTSASLNQQSMKAKLQQYKHIPQDVQDKNQDIPKLT